MNTERVRLEVTPETIFGTNFFDVLEPVWWTMNIYDGPEIYEESVRVFSTEQRLMCALYWYRCEVNNGGHDQFYSNSTGIVWPDALRALQALGLTEGVAILEEAARRLGGSPSLNRDERGEQIEASAADFDDLDRRFYAFEESTNIYAAMLQYMREHIEKFTFSGWVERPASQGPDR